VSFKDKDCVTETIDEIDIVKSKLVGKDHYEMLHVQNWDVEQASPVSDIIWTEMNKGKARSLPVRLLLSLLPLILSAIVVFFLVVLDQQLNDKVPSYFLVFMKYLISLGLCLFNFYFLPAFIFKIVQVERYERISTKESNLTFMNITFMLLNTLVFPVIASAVLTYLD
jgi:hypothetical protein